MQNDSKQTYIEKREENTIGTNATQLEKKHSSQINIFHFQTFLQQTRIFSLFFPPKPKTKEFPHTQQKKLNKKL